MARGHKSVFNLKGNKGRKARGGKTGGLREGLRTRSVR